MGMIARWYRRFIGKSSDSTESRSCGCLSQKVTRQASVFVLLVTVLTGCTQSDWRNASREPAGIAPDPALTPEAVIEVYGADAFGWRGWIAIHTWIALKPANAESYTVHEVVGWRLRRGESALYRYQTSTPDRFWYGSKPEKILAIQGDEASRLIPKIEAAIERYPWPDEYSVFPGPNSNTFPAWVGKQVPELKLELPFRAIGSGFID